ncbi:hypothetical protein Cri9333_1389 [Crinalium epipsammum PCC 9333]|uniref:Uncharacterized protein n=1 Tax=Crinalium epipsammum PCC 9333 TaxID=1173022 RepID=K9VVZ9_9CYAN|nr:hypothetical protein [Crinalium epipsammum]AFZ12283.1 hypothetical protein Cri9333_1389 [Crinalium epipsammum PCC 9333]
MNLVQVLKYCRIIPIALVGMIDVASAAPLTANQAAQYAQPIFAKGFNNVGLGPTTKPNEVAVLCRRVPKQVNTFSCSGRRLDKYCSGTMTVYKTAQNKYKHKNDNFGCVAS